MSEQKATQNQGNGGEGEGEQVSMESQVSRWPLINPRS